MWERGKSTGKWIACHECERSCTGNGMDRLIRIEGKIKKEARSHGRKPEQTEQKKIEKQSG